MSILSLKPIFPKTRFAPTPSGYLHLGNILSFGITAALAKQHGAKILLRIDDLDQPRANPLYVQDIFDTLNFLGIAWDVGPTDPPDFKKNWSQVGRMDLYNKAIAQLKDTDCLFTCTCSRNDYAAETCTCSDKKLPFDTPLGNWRMKTDKCLLKIKQLDGTIIESALPDKMQNFIVRKKDGYPSYQLASIMDDLHYGIDLVVRGQDLWDSTLAQHFLAEKLNEPAFGEIKFFHHLLITEYSGEKLSKSAGATSVKYLRENGNSPADIFIDILRRLDIVQVVNNWNEFISALALNICPDIKTVSV